jgi:hypothetical protein
MPTPHVEKIRNEILLQCYGYRPQARDAVRIVRTAVQEGELVGVVVAEVDREAAYLADLGLITIVADDVSPGHKRYAITAKGIQHLEAKDLA